jgi:hypothetical protein
VIQIKPSIFGRRGQWTVYRGRLTDSRFTRKSDAEARFKELGGKLPTK